MTKRLAPWLAGSTMYDPVEHARRAYGAYGDHAGWTNYRDEPMPDWNGLGDTVRGHWIAATQALLGDEDANG